MKKQLLLILMTLLPMMANADESGTCGDNLTWTYIESSKTLTIEGIGPMYDYLNNNTPWENLKSDIKTVNVSSEVTNIGKNAFYRCSNLENAIIPNTITEIRGAAFRFCSKLSKIDIPNNLKTIGRYTFEECSSLVSIIIPASLTRINEYAFNHCCALTSIIVDENNAVYDSRDNCNAIIETSKNALILGCKNTTIPNTVISIENGAFAGCTDLTSLFIPYSVYEISATAFNYCSSLSSIVVEDSNAFYDSRENCNAIIKTSTNALILGCKNTTIPQTVTSIDQFAFYGCENLISLTIPYGITSISNSAFYGCKSLKSVELPNSLYSIEDYAFDRCFNLESIIIPYSVSSIGKYVFLGCYNISSFIVETDNQNYDSRNNCNALIETYTGTLLFGCKNTIIPIGVRAIGSYSFYGNIDITSLNLPEGVEKLEEKALYDCSKLSDIIIPASVVSIGANAFGYCQSMKDIYCYTKEIPVTGSDIFIEVDIANATLHVPAALVNVYKVKDQWKNFGNIVALTDSDPKPTGIKAVKVDDGVAAREYYSLDGKQQSGTSKGLNIVRMNEGTIKKVVVK